MHESANAASSRFCVLLLRLHVWCRQATACTSSDYPPRSSELSAPEGHELQEALAHPRAAAQLGHFVRDVLAWRNCKRRRALVVIGPPDPGGLCLLTALADLPTDGSQVCDLARVTPVG